MSDVDEAVLTMWAQDELPGAIKPVSSLHLGTVCNCGEKLNCEFFCLKLFLYRRSVALLRPRWRWMRRQRTRRWRTRRRQTGRSRPLDHLAFAVGGAPLSHHPTCPLWTLWRGCVKIIVVIILSSMYHID